MSQENQLDSLPVPSCEKCGKEGWKAIFTCPERPSGQCPYITEAWGQHFPSKASGIIPVIFMLIFLLMIVSSVLKWKLESVFFIGALALLAIWLLLGVLATQTQLYCPGSGIRLGRAALWDIELSRTWVPKGELMPVEMALVQPLLYPPSVTALAADVSSFAILFTTLVGLLAQKYIQVYHYQSCTCGIGSIRRTVEDIHRITAAQRPDQPQVAGYLEKRITKALADWSASEKAEDWPKGMPIGALVAAIYDKCEYSPEEWVTQLVTKNAVAKGWGEMTGTWRKRLKWKSVAADRLRLEGRILQTLADQLATSHPKLLLALGDQIQRGMDSRRVRSDGPFVDGM